MNRILEVVAKIKSSYEERHAKLLAAFREENSDIDPTVDSRGRLHAPVNGYMVPENWDCGCGKIFAAGQFIPTPKDPDADYFFGGNWEVMHSAKVRAPLSQIEGVAKFIESNGVPATVEHGKSWEQNGIPAAYAYIKAQWKSLVDAIAAELEEIAKPELPKAPEVYLNGKATITGEVVKVKAQESYYGYQLKMMVICPEGFKVWGSVPSALDGVKKGDVVTFTANFEAGESGMSWFKRPTKAVFVSVENAEE